MWPVIAAVVSAIAQAIIAAETAPGEINTPYEAQSQKIGGGIRPKNLSYLGQNSPYSQSMSRFTPYTQNTNQYQRRNYLG